MKCNRVLFHTPSFHILQFSIVFYKPAAVTPWYNRVIIFSISSRLRHRTDVLCLGFLNAMLWDVLIGHLTCD